MRFSDTNSGGHSASTETRHDGGDLDHAKPRISTERARQPGRLAGNGVGVIWAQGPGGEDDNSNKYALYYGRSIGKTW